MALNGGAPKRRKLDAPTTGHSDVPREALVLQRTDYDRAVDRERCNTRACFDNSVGLTDIKQYISSETRR